MSTPYRPPTLREPPERANYEHAPLGVEQVRARMAVGDGNALQNEAKLRAKTYMTLYHSPFDYDFLPPRDVTVALRIQRVQDDQLDSDKTIALISMLNVRIELDDQANRLAIYVVNSANGAYRLHAAKLPSIKSFNFETYNLDSMGELEEYFYALQDRFSPGWQEILQPSSGVYDRPAEFLVCIVCNNNYKTVANIQPVVSGFFELCRSSSSLPNVGSVDECLDIVTNSLSMAVLS